VAAWVNSVGGMAIAPHPNNVRAAIAEEALRELYVTQGLTLEEVARRCRVALTTVRRRLRDLGIRARPRGPVPISWPGQPGTADCFTWTAELAYVVGLITTDGCLSNNGRTIALTSKDRDLLEVVRLLLHGRGSIGQNDNGRGQGCFKYQLTSRRLYLWLSEIGLMPAKSLRLDELAVPDEVFPDFLRGCIDGDGSIVTYRDHYNARKSPKYVYDRFYVSVVSASRPFLEWMRCSVKRLRGLSGHLTVRRIPQHHDLWCLRYAKRESVSLLRWVYYAPDVPALRRKRERADRALAEATWYRHSLSDVDAR
jgi:hypothetical protein